MLTIRQTLSVLILVLMEDTLGELRLIFLCLSLFEVYLLLIERFS